MQLLLRRYYHPNINLSSQKFSTKALHAAWSPKMGLKGFCWLLHDLLIAPDPDHATNTRAARDMIDDPDKFQRDVQVRSFARSFVRGRVRACVWSESVHNVCASCCCCGA